MSVMSTGQTNRFSAFVRDVTMSGLLEMMLPTIMGTDVLRALKDQPATKDISIFVLTGLPKERR
jgi:response regulator RpfG family c-di-GMP phosphodiesterase